LLEGGEPRQRVDFAFLRPPVETVRPIGDETPQGGLIRTRVPGSEPGLRERPPGARESRTETVDVADGHGFSPAGSSRAWPPAPEGWGDWAIEAQQAASDSPLRTFTEVMALRDRLVRDGTLRVGEPGHWSVTLDGLVLCHREGGVTVAIAMGDEPVAVPAGRVLFGTAPLLEGGLLEPDNPAWILRA
jgi:alpha-glucosidase